MIVMKMFTAEDKGHRNVHLQQAETAKAERHRASRGRVRADPDTVQCVPPVRKERITQSGMVGEPSGAM